MSLFALHYSAQSARINYMADMFTTDALVWGASARHVPQRVGLGHMVADEDVGKLDSHILFRD